MKLYKLFIPIFLSCTQAFAAQVPQGGLPEFFVKALHHLPKPSLDPIVRAIEQNESSVEVEIDGERFLVKIGKQEPVSQNRKMSKQEHHELWNRLSPALPSCLHKHGSERVLFFSECILQNNKERTYRLYPVVFEMVAKDKCMVNQDYMVPLVATKIGK